MEIIKVTQFEYKQASAPDILDSTGLGPCIAVGAIYRGKGYMLHTHGDGLAYNESFDDQIFVDLSEIPDKKGLKIYIAGGAFFHHFVEARELDDLIAEIDEDPDTEDPDMDLVTMLARMKIQAKIKKYGLEDYVQEIRWGLMGEGLYIILNLSEGEGEIKEF
tara:strand:+ start:525 stop:1010 length:486 start_codon:yes stop_codon:yes gene_type:complete